MQAKHAQPRARFICPDTVYHVVNRVAGGSFLLVPKPEVSAIVIGVLAMARLKYKRVSLFEAAFLSNHFHLLLQGPPVEFSRFVGFVKREISRRLGQLYDWEGTMWAGRFKATALPTVQSQLAAAKYVLSQGVKEDLVEHSSDWPGLHSAKMHRDGLLFLEGVWLDGTGYSIARDRAHRSGKKLPQKDHFEHRVQLSFDLLPAYQQVWGAQFQIGVAQMLDDIHDEHAVRRREMGIQVLGARRAAARSISTRSTIPKRSWLDRHRRLLAWADPKAPETRAYVQQYWSFQQAFAAAAKDAQENRLVGSFPPSSFIPGHYCSLES